MSVAVVGFSHCVLVMHWSVSGRSLAFCLRCLVSPSEDLQLFLAPDVYEIVLSNVWLSSWAAREHQDLPSWSEFGQAKMSFVVSVQAILLSPKFHCAEEILTIVSLLSVDSVLHNPPAQRDEVQAVRKKFISSEGDHLTLLNVYRAYKNVNGHQVG